MRAEQYAYFAAFSSHMSAAEMEQRIGLSADHTLVRGSKDPDRPVPVQHMWAIESQRSGRWLHDHIEDVLSRIAPVEAELTALHGEIESDGGFVFQLVRYLNDPDADDSGSGPLGFGFQVDALELLARLGARISVDEYDCAPSDR